MSDYADIKYFGCSTKTPQSEIFSYCAVTQMDANFNHTAGRFLGPDSKQCAIAMPQVCAQDWNGVCEYMSKNQSRHLPNMNTQGTTIPQTASIGVQNGNYLTQGEILVRNTAMQKYMTHMSGNCVRVYEPFDPLNPDSPLISTWVPNGNTCTSTGKKCIPKYNVDVKEIDSDPVMEKILAKPSIAIDILINIYNNRKNDNELGKLKGTKLYKLFTSSWFQKLVNN